MKITIEYNISDDGDCSKCLAQFMTGIATGVCMPFRTNISDHVQCQDCKDYLKWSREKNK